MLAARLAATAIVGWASIPDAALAGDDHLQASKPQVAEVVTLAKMAPTVCAWIGADEDAIRDLMARSGITDQDVTDPGVFGPADATVALSFARSVQKDADRACSELFAALGPTGGRLLRPKSSIPQF